MLLLTVFGVCMLSSMGHCAKILGMWHYNGHSHFVMFENLMKGLAARGHEVHVVSHFPQKNAPANYADISINGSVPPIMNTMKIEYVRSSLSVYNVWYFFWVLGLSQCERMMQHPNIKKLTGSDEKYDLLITEIFNVDCFLGFAHKFDVPVVSLTASVIYPTANDRVGNPDNPSYIPHTFLPYTPHMTFIQRVTNSAVVWFYRYCFYWYTDPSMEDINRKYLGDSVPAMSELRKRTSLVLTNSHFSLDYSRPLVPGVLEVAGLHIQPPKALPEDLKNFIDAAEHGVILFSFGSVVLSETMKPDLLEAFLKVFSSLKQRVLWKSDPQFFGQLPNNIKISPWLPQADILSHPNIRLFISHGGSMGVMEAIWYAVPVVGIPLYADQFPNLQKMADHGAAAVLQFDDISEESIRDALKRVLDDRSYRENAQRLSSLFRDRPMPPLDSSIYWVEYVIRHGGASHLKPASVELPLYQYLLLDVFALIGVAVFLLVMLLFFMIKSFLVTLVQVASQRAIGANSQSKKKKN